MNSLFSVFLLNILINLQLVSANSGDPFTLIDAVQTECEFEGLTWGSRLADAWNSQDETIDFKLRFSHEFLSQSPSFSKMMHHETLYRPAVFEGVLPRHYREGSSHHGSHKGAPPFSPINGKWIYFLGDSSLYPLWASLKGSVHGEFAYSLLCQLIIIMLAHT
jgi:hypothetical protein